MEIDIWTYRQAMSPKDLIGFSVEASDGSIGKVDKATYDVGASYLVVDTGPWIFGRKVLLPAYTVSRIDAEDRTVFVDRTKDEIKDGPEYDADMWNDSSRDEYDKYYGQYYRA
jgi:hypothetical protein